MFSFRGHTAYEQLQHALHEIPLDFSNISEATINEYTQRILSKSKATYDHVAQLVRLNFSSCIQPFINLEIAIQNAQCLVTTAQYYHPCETVRQASLVATHTLQKFKIEQMHRQDVYKSFELYWRTVFPFERDLTKEDILYVNNLHLSYKRNGLELDSISLQAEVCQIQLELADNYACDDSLQLDVNYLEFKEQEIAGVPETWLHTFERCHDMYKVHLTEKNLQMILEYVDDRAVRSLFYIAYHNFQAAVSSKVLTKNLKLRQRLAVLLGYESYVDYANEINMHKSASNIDKFITDMHYKFKSAQQNCLVALQSFAREFTSDPSFVLQHFDVPYMMRMHAKVAFGVDEHQVRQYFPINTVMCGALGVFAKLFNISFESCDKTSTWCADVTCFNVNDLENNEFLGVIYFDLFVRQGKSCDLKVLPLTLAADGVRFTDDLTKHDAHRVLMMGNYTKDATLSFSEVRRFLQALSKAVSGLHSKVQIVSHNSLSDKMAKDFASVPEQMLKNLCYEESVLLEISQHIVTGETIPYSLVEKIIATEQAHAGFLKKKELCLATFDCVIHQLDSEQLANCDLQQYWNKLQQDLILLPSNNECVPINLDSQTYCSMYSEVIAMSMFHEQFICHALNRKSCSCFKTCILQPGATLSPETMVKDFIGHAPNADAYMWRTLGLVLPKTILRRQTAEFSPPFL